MKIEIKSSSGRHFALRLPTRLVINRITAPLIAQHFRKKGVLVESAQLRRFLRALFAYKRAHRDWTLMEADLKDGCSIRIKV